MRTCVLGASALMVLLAGGLAGCSDDPKNMNHSYTLTDENGDEAGTMTLTPTGGGVVTDNNGAVVGRVDNPASP